MTNTDADKLRAEVEAFVKAITDAGANTSGGEPKEQNSISSGQDQSDGPKVVLSRSDESAARDEALQKAVEKAVRNAKAIAKGLGGGEIKVISVTDSEPEKPAAEPLNIYGIDTGSTPKVPAGMVEIKVRVVVKCSYSTPRLGRMCLTGPVRPTTLQISGLPESPCLLPPPLPDKDSADPPPSPKIEPESAAHGTKVSVSPMRRKT